MKKQFVIGVDIGTTSTKAVLFNFNGVALAKLDRAYPLFTPTEGCAEQDPEEIFQAVIASIQGVLQRAAVGGEQIACVSFSAAMHSFIVMSKEGKPLTRCITWADNRSARVAERIDREMDGRSVYLRTGTPIHPMSPLSKILWLKETWPDIFQDAYKYISIKEYVFFKLFGQYVVDYSIASATGLFNLGQLRWDEGALRIANITTDKLSELYPTTHYVSGLKDGYAQTLGLKQTTPFVLGASDGVLSNLGVGAITPGTLAATIGTSGAVRMTVSRPVTDIAQRTFCYCLTEQHWVIGGAVNNGGIMLRWLRDELGANEIETAKRLGRDPYELLAEIAAGVPPGSLGLIFMPFLTGERAPHWNADARGAFVGLSMQHKRQHFIRAVMEGVMYNLWTVAEAMREMGNSGQEIKATGGFTRSPLWRQMMSDIFEQQVTVPVSYESSCLGAAVLGMIALKEMDRIEDIASLIGSEESHLPNEQTYPYYRPLKSLFTQLYVALEPHYKELSSYQNEISKNV